MMDKWRLGDFVEKINCSQVLLGHPVISHAGKYVTVAFDFYPRASDYERFIQAGWTVHGHLGHNDLCLNIHNRKFYEVTFRDIHPESTPTLPCRIKL